MPAELRVVDASAVAALLFVEPRAGEVVDRFGGGLLVAPTLLWYELASVCLKKLQSYPEQREALLEALSMLEMLGIQEMEVPLSRDLLLLAETHNLSTYDASYLWLTRALGAELVTLDGDLQAAFDTSG